MQIPQNIYVEGKLVYLKRLDERNATQEYCKWLNDPEVTENLVTVGTTINELKKYITEKNKSQNCVFLGIFFKENGRHIGNIKLEPVDFEGKKGIIGILIGDKSYWRKGIGTETIWIFTKWIFDVLKLERIEAGAFPENIASIKTFRKAGFAIDRMEPKSVMHKGRLSDNIIMVVHNKNQSTELKTQD